MADGEDRIGIRDARAMLLLEKLGRSPERRVRRGIRWPGGTAKVRLRVLSSEELQLAQAGAVKRFVDELKWEPSGINAEEFTCELADQVLARALEDDDAPLGTPLLPGRDVDLLRRVTDDDDRQYLWREYASLKADTDPESDPDSMELSSTEIAAISTLLKKKDASRLRRLDASTLRSYMRSMASRQSDSPTGRSASGSAPSERPVSPSEIVSSDSDDEAPE